MMIIKDSMVLIHLAKTTLLETSCEYFKKVVIPLRVKEEVVKEGYQDSIVINELIMKKKILIKMVKNNSLIKKANEFNIQRAEAEVVALYWELNADLIATDDDNVRKKQDVLKLKIIGTPSIMLKLYKEKKINKIKLEDSIKKLKDIGWFSNSVWDRILMEVNKNE